MTVGPTLLFAAAGWDGHMNANGAWWVAMALGMVLFWSLVILGIAWLVRDLFQARRSGRPTDEETHLAILGRRLALGEISADEYREYRAILEEKPERRP